MGKQQLAVRDGERVRGVIGRQDRGERDARELRPVQRQQGALVRVFRMALRVQVLRVDVELRARAEHGPDPRILGIRPAEALVVRVQHQHLLPLLRPLLRPGGARGERGRTEDREDGEPAE